MIESKFKHASNDAIIPSDWVESDLLGVTTKIGSGATPTGGDASYTHSGTSLIRSLNVHNNTFIYDKLAHINEEQAYELDGVAVEKNDVLINITGASVARCCIVPGDILPARVNQHVSILRTNPSKIDYRYLSLLLTSPWYQKDLHKRSKGNGGTREALTKKMLQDYIITLPKDTDEQIRIATALSDIDSLISTLQYLIEKKRSIKQGAMQELLSGKRRLKGYSDKWIEISLGELCKPRKGSQINKNDLKEDSVGYPVMNGGISPSGYHEDYNADSNTIIISEGGNSCGFVNFMTTRFWAGGHCYVLDPQEGNDTNYIYQVLKYYESQIMALRTGSGLPNIKKSALWDFKFRMTPDPTEQSAITAVLSDMDSEISALEGRLEKYQGLKQGMMQQLLTGKIRLI